MTQVVLVWKKTIVAEFNESDFYKTQIFTQRMKRTRLTSPYLRWNHTSVKDLKASLNNAGFYSHFIILLVLTEKNQKTGHNFLFKLFNSQNHYKSSKFQLDFKTMRSIDMLYLMDTGVYWKDGFLKKCPKLQVLHTQLKKRLSENGEFDSGAGLSPFLSWALTSFPVTEHSFLSTLGLGMRIRYLFWGKFCSVGLAQWWHIWSKYN